MSREMTIRCDVCGEFRAMPLTLLVGTEAGDGELEPIIDLVDLCHECAMEALVVATAPMAYANRKRFLSSVRELKP